MPLLLQTIAVQTEFEGFYDAQVLHRRIVGIHVLQFRSAHWSI